MPDPEQAANGARQQPGQPDAAPVPGAPGQFCAHPAGPEAEGDGCVIERVPLFPLLNVVLFPCAVLPLHIFEQRYRVMTADALGLNGSKAPDGRGLVCMCRIKPGHDPMDDQPPVFEAACVGRIVHHDRLADGRYNFLLQGLRRVLIGREYPLGEPDAAGTHGDRRPYRRADLQPVACQKAFEIDVGEARQKMQSLCHRPQILDTPVGRHLERLFCSCTPTVQLADVLAFDLIEDADERQRLLEETDERRRVQRISDLLERQFPDPASPLSHASRFDVEEA